MEAKRVPFPIWLWQHGPRNTLISGAKIPLASGSPPRLHALDIPYSYALQGLCLSEQPGLMCKVP